MTTPVTVGLRVHERYEARIEPDIPVFLEHCRQLEQPTTLPFGTESWLRAWYATFGHCDGRAPLPVVVTKGDRGEVAALLPLVTRRLWGLRLVEFADAGVTDYQAPLLAAEWHAGSRPGEAATALWLAVRKALQGQDLFHMDKQLARQLDVAGLADNPLVLALPVRESRFSGSAFTAPQGWEAWRHSLDKSVRKELERCWRVFQRDEQARFDLVSDPVEARELLEILEQQQGQRMRALGKPYRLDEPAYREFYRCLLKDGLAGGRAVLGSLRSRGEVVAVLFGVSNSQRFIALRQSMSQDPLWRPISPGRLLYEACARALHTQGRMHCDFGIGQYRHKAMFKPERIPLYEACVALTWRGAVARCLWQFKRAVQARRARQGSAAAVLASRKAPEV